MIDKSNDFVIIIAIKNDKEARGASALVM
jgi:hypothetical protein